MAKAKTNGTGRKRGRPAKKTVDKADAVEVRTGELELKQVEIDDGDFDLHFRGVKAAKEKMEQYQSAYRSALKSAKKVSDDLANSIKDALRFETMDSHDIKRQLEISGYVLKRQGSPIQLTIHDGLLGDALEVAFKRGEADGLAGKGNANPYPASSDLAGRYDTGHIEGQTQLIAKGQPAQGTNSGEGLPLQ